MRVTQKIIYSHIIENLGNITEDIKNLNEMISSGKKIRHPSDDPIGTVNILEIEKLLSSIKQYRRN
ncbi:MAG TPA: flagellar hook-associated protein 3, partial [Candidatus Desulfofervidus auxilii]|nr:flagellar hook-associated protein 3 [Candidatus Desulfofervidus auxilii]